MNKTTPRSTAHPDWEALSSLADGELEGAAADALLAALCRDPELRQEWITLHVVGDALRSSDVAAAHSESFCERVRAALEREPTVLAPRTAQQPGRARPLRAYLLPGAAIAASAAVIGFVAVPLLQAPPAVQPVVAAAPAQATASAAVATSRRAAATLASARAFDVYLAAHREVATGVALPRATPYLRTPDQVSEGR